uniref:Uncharacterized protein n=1 Tax=Oryza punctata TaxID=4537 RepID=A0A0E0L6F9_ORYPU
MVFDIVVVASQNSESLSSAIPHVDVHVHSARPQQCWVKPLSVVCCEDDDPLLAAAGLGSLDLSFLPLLQVDAAVNVFNDEDGSVAHPDEQPPEVRVGLDLGELKIVYVKLEVVGHGGNEAGLAGARWAVEQVSSLPRPANPPVVVFPLDKPLKIVHDGLLQAVIHGERVEGGGVAQVDGGPGVVLDHVHLEVPVLVVHGLGCVDDEGEVRPERLLLVLLVEAQLEGLDLEAAAAPPAGAAAADAVGGGVGGGGGGGGGVAGDEAPGVVDAVVDVEHLLALVHGDHDALGVVDAAGAEALHVGVDPRGERPSVSSMTTVWVDETRARMPLAADRSSSRSSSGTSSLTTPRTTMAVPATAAAVAMYFS